MHVDGPACFPTSRALHKKEVDYYSYEIYVENAGNVEVKPSAEGQPSTQVIIEKLIFNDPNQLKHLVKEILEEKLLKDDQITHFKEVYTTTQDGGAENPIEIDPSSITSCASNRPEGKKKLFSSFKFIYKTQNTTNQDIKSKLNYTYL